MRKLQTQGCHHITLVGADRQTSIDFWEGVLGMPFVSAPGGRDRGARDALARFALRRPLAEGGIPVTLTDTDALRALQAPLKERIASSRRRRS